VVLATSTMNRIMVVELAMPAVLPGMLVALHYLVQMARPRFGHGSDVGGRLTRWIVGGMGVLALGGVGASLSVALIAGSPTAGIFAAIASYLLIGLGVGACGTSLLVLLAKRVEPKRRPAAATITWVMMIAGFVITTGVAGQLLEPYSHARLVAVTLAVTVTGLIITTIAVWGIEGTADGATRPPATTAAAAASFRGALSQVWRERTARQFAVFVFISMLAYSGQELIFEPFVGSVFNFTPAQSARLSSLQHGGALVGMVLIALICGLAGRTRWASLRTWTVSGCIGSAAALLGLVAASHVGSTWPLHANVFVLGLANGVFAVAAVGSMMALGAAGDPARQGVRMGLWGAAQAVAFALGGLLSSAAVDLFRYLAHSALTAYALVFAAQAGLFLVGAVLAAAVGAAIRPITDERSLEHRVHEVSA
jgi:BCD family chlorophyll transporter-like MFS transporter